MIKPIAPLHAQLRECLAQEDISSLDLFLNKELWKDLEERERASLAKLFIKRGENAVIESSLDFDSAEKILVDSLAVAEELVPDNADLLCRQALMLFRFGIVSENTHYFLQALQILNKAEAIDSELFEKKYSLWHLWGNILTALGRHIDDMTLIEKALLRYKTAEKLFREDCSVTSPFTSESKSRDFCLFSLIQDRPSFQENFGLAQDFYWDWGKAWILLGKKSGERTDFQEGLEKFSIVERLGCGLPHFHVEYGEALVALGLMDGNPQFILMGIDHFKKVISLSENPDAQSKKIASKKAWISYALAHSQLTELTGSQRDFELADSAFREAILAIPKYSELWLHWGKMHLTQGWHNRSISLVESGLEKLTSSKISECDPLEVAALLGEGLAIMGLFLEDFKLLKEGQKRISAALKANPQSSTVIQAAGLCFLVQGLYFSDNSYLVKAKKKFQAILKKIPNSVSGNHFYYQTLFVQGILNKDKSPLKKAIQIATRLTELRPVRSSFFRDCGVALLRLYQTDKKKTILLEKALQLFKKAIELRREDEDSLLDFHEGCVMDLLGDIYLDEVYYEKAIDSFLKVLEFNPQSLNAKFHLALSLSHLGELTSHEDFLYQAAQLFEKIVSQDLEDDVAWCEWGYTLLNLSEIIVEPYRVDEKSELKEKAEKALMKAIQLGNNEACYHLACLYSLHGSLERAMEFLWKAKGANALPNARDLIQDNWLENVRSTEDFQALISNRKKRRRGQ